MDNTLIVNIAVLLIFIVVLFMEIMRIKIEGKARIVVIIATSLAIALMIFAIVRGVPISQLQPELVKVLS